MKIKISNSMLNVLLGGRFRSGGTVFAPQPAHNSNVVAANQIIR